MIEPNKLFGRLGNRLFHMAFIFARMRDGLLPDMYVQDYRLFKNYEKEIKEWFGTGVGYLDYVSIHVRRGDYVNNPFYVQLWETDYYEKAIALFPGDNFVVFSDDVEYCKEKWGNDPRFKIMEKGDEVEDFNLASSCKHHIISNSSFSWWYAFVSPNLGKQIVMPQHWFSDGVERVISPESWIRI